MNSMNEWFRRAKEAGFFTVGEQQTLRELMNTLGPDAQNALSILCNAAYKLGQLADSEVKPNPDELPAETKKWLDAQTPEERLETIKDICLDWDGYRTAAGLGGLINEIWAYAAYPYNNKAHVMHGRWMMTDAYPHKVYCSECYKTFAQTHWAVWEDGSLPRDFCPNCGARMDGGKDDGHD